MGKRITINKDDVLLSKASTAIENSASESDYLNSNPAFNHQESRNGNLQKSTVNKDNDRQSNNERKNPTDPVVKIEESLLEPSVSVTGQKSTENNSGIDSVNGEVEIRENHGKGDNMNTATESVDLGLDSSDDHNQRESLQDSEISHNNKREDENNSAAAENDSNENENLPKDLPNSKSQMQPLLRNNTVVDKVMCSICGIYFSGKSLSSHLRSVHNVMTKNAKISLRMTTIL